MPPAPHVHCFPIAVDAAHFSPANLNPASNQAKPAAGRQAHSEAAVRPEPIKAPGSVAQGGFGFAVLFRPEAFAAAVVAVFTDFVVVSPVAGAQSDASGCEDAVDADVLAPAPRIAAPRRTGWRSKGSSVSMSSSPTLSLPLSPPPPLSPLSPAPNAAGSRPAGLMAAYSRSSKLLRLMLCPVARVCPAPARGKWRSPACGARLDGGRHARCP
jgi:hypothetical protein